VIALSSGAALRGSPLSGGYAGANVLTAAGLHPLPVGAQP
jgi:hypothetical protein